MTIYTLFNTYSPVELRDNLISLLSAHTVMEQISIGTVIVKGFVASNVILVFVIVETACSYDYGWGLVAIWKAVQLLSHHNRSLLAIPEDRPF